MPASKTETTPWPVRLPTTLLQRWRAMASREGMTAAAALRRVMVAVLDGAEAEVGLPVRASQAKTGRLSITLKLSELKAVRAAAKAEGRSLANWIAMLIRARLQQQPLYTREEHMALVGVQWELGEIGRKLQPASAPQGRTAQERRQWEAAEKARLAEVRQELERTRRQLEAMHVLASERTRRL